MFKNQPNQKWTVLAFDVTDGTRVTGDATGISADISIDYGSRTAITDINPTETILGKYQFDLTQAETNGDVLEIFPSSVTQDVSVIGIPEVIYTQDAVTLDEGSLTGIITGIFDFADGIENNYTLKETLRLMSAALLGKTEVSGTTITFKDMGDNKDRITSDVNENGERTSIILDAT